MYLNSNGFHKSIVKYLMAVIYKVADADMTLDNIVSQTYITDDGRFISRVSERVPGNIKIRFDQSCFPILRMISGGFSDNNTYYAMCIDEEDKKYMNWRPYVNTVDDESIYKTIITVNKDMLVGVIRELFKLGIEFEKGAELFIDIIPEIKERQESWIKNMVGLTKDVRTEVQEKLTSKEVEDFFKLLLPTMELSKEDNKRALEQFYNGLDFSDVPMLKDMHCENSRVFIPLLREDAMRMGYSTETATKGVYVVFSRNPYDWFFCSWGTDWTSCFTWTTSSAIKGYYKFMLETKGIFVYLSTGTVRKTSFLPSMQIKHPSIDFRMWSHVTVEGKLAWGREYMKRHLEDCKSFVKAKIHELPWMHEDDSNKSNPKAIELANGKEVYQEMSKNGRQIYMDAITFNNSTLYGKGFYNGQHGQWWLKDLNPCRSSDNINVVANMFAHKVNVDFDTELLWDRVLKVWYSPVSCKLNLNLISDSEIVKHLEKKFNVTKSTNIIAITYMTCSDRVSSNNCYQYYYKTLVSDSITSSRMSQGTPFNNGGYQELRTIPRMENNFSYLQNRMWDMTCYISKNLKPKNILNEHKKLLKETNADIVYVQLYDGLEFHEAVFTNQVEEG